MAVGVGSKDGVMASGLAPWSHGPILAAEVVEYCLRIIYLSAILSSVGSLFISISLSSTAGAGTISHIYLHFSIYLTYFASTAGAISPIYLSFSIYLTYFVLFDIF